MMASKQLEVLEWLSELYGENDVPIFEKTEENITKLLQLMLSHGEANKDKQLVDKYLEIKIEDYDTKAKELEHNLQELGLTDDNLTVDKQKCIGDLSAICSALDLKTTNAPNMILALNSLMQEDRELEHYLEIEEIFTKKLLEFKRNVATSVKMFERLSEEFESEYPERKEEAKAEAMNHDFNKLKAQKYENNLSKLQYKLQDLNFNENHDFDSTSKKVQDLFQLEQELAKKEKTLENFSELPADVSLARLKVELLKRECTSAMANFDSQ